MKNICMLFLFWAVPILACAQEIKKVFNEVEAYNYDYQVGDYELLKTGVEINTVTIRDSDITIVSQNGKSKRFTCYWKDIGGNRCLVEEGNESVFVIKEDYLMWFFVFDGKIHRSLIMLK